MENYNILVNEGGRPSWPVGLGRDIRENPGEYREILSYWQLVDGDAENRTWEVFEQQVRRWRGFGKWQRFSREEGRFCKHVERVKGRLAKHGFTRPFQLENDLEQQDTLTTWIEYLGYEYWFYDKDMNYVKRNQPDYDKAWKELVDSRVLRPFETEKSLFDFELVFQRMGEEDRAKEAVEAAKSVMTKAQIATTHPQGPGFIEKEAQRQLETAQSNLSAAMKFLESVKHRKNLIHEFFMKTTQSQITNSGRRKKSYVSAKDDAERRRILLRWIQQQIPLIELELSSVTKNDSAEANSISCDRTEFHEEQSTRKGARKRSRQNDITDEELPSKRLRNDNRSLNGSVHNPADVIPSGIPQTHGTTTPKSVKRRKMESGTRGVAIGESCDVEGNLSTVNPSQPRKSHSQGVPIRRSARIAERERFLKASVVAPSDTVRAPRHRTTKLAQALKLPSSTKLEERKSTSRTTKTSTRSKINRNNRLYTSKPPGISKKRGRTRSQPLKG